MTIAEIVLLTCALLIGGIIVLLFARALIREQNRRMQADFENLANRIFEEKSARLSDQSKTDLGQLLSPLREQLRDFRGRIEDIYDREARQMVSLEEHVKRLDAANQQISRDAVNLTNALKGESKTQGNWGEIILEKVLEHSGLTCGREYDVQVSVQADDGRRLMPDVIVHLPGDRDVVIDSKVSLTAYERYSASDDDAEREQTLKEHIASLRKHVKELAEKQYDELPGIRALDMVLMFVPVEPAFLAALQYDRDLFNDAFGKKIFMVSPSTLLLTLRIVENMWRTEDQSKHALDIAQKAGDLYDKLVAFVEDLENIGKHLDRARDAYAESHKKLSTGKGNLVKRSQDLLAMGVKARKKLPPEMIEHIEESEES